MKIVVVGGAGTIGRVLTQYFAEEHEVLTAGRSSGDLPIDLADVASIKNFYETAPNVDAVICCAGEAKWAPFDQMTEEDFLIGIRSKLMGQVNLIKIGCDYLKPGASVTLTTGILGEDPVQQTASAAMVNGGVNSFVKAASLDLGHRLRINAVAPGLVEDAAEKYRGYFPGHVPVSMERVIKAYERSIMGSRTGEVISVY